MLLVNSGIGVMTADGLVSYTPGESITYTKSIGAEHTTDLANLTVITADGTASYDMTTEYYNNYTNLYQSALESGVSISGGSAALPSLLNILSYKTIVTHEAVKAPGSSSNFVFIGRGWGHGVGLSQYGALNLAQLGYDSQSILAAYFPGTEITVLP